MKKYYFEPVGRCLVYLVIAIVLIGMLVICFFADEIHSGVIFLIISFSVSSSIILFWFCYSLTMRIQIDPANL